MASRVYDELYAEYGRMPTEEEVRLRLEQKLGRDRATTSAEDTTSRTVAAAGSLAPPGEVPKEEEPHNNSPLSRTTRYRKLILPTAAPTHETKEKKHMRVRGIVKRLISTLNLFALVGILLAVVALAGCGGSQEQDSQGEQGSQEETTIAPSGGSTNVQGGDATSRTVAATEAFLATLDDAQREQVSFDFDSDAKSGWNNFPVPVVPRNGVPFSDMTEEQQQAAMAILQAALSEEGYKKTVGIMVGDQVVREEEGKPDLFGLDFYGPAIFGTPSETEPWTLQFNGHHLGLNLTVSGQDNVLMPSFVGVQPADYTLDEAGDLTAFEPASLLPTGTVRPMAEENDKAFELMNALDAQQQEEATLDYEVSELVLGPGEDGRVLEPEGLPVSEMDADQQALLLDLIRQWVGIVNDETAEARMSEIEDGLDETYFAWSGPTTNGSLIYYRITGPTLHIEFAHQMNDVQHIHSVYRDPTREYGEQPVA